MPDDDPGGLEGLLPGLTGRVPGARSAVLLGRGGMVIAEAGLDPDSADNLAAIAAMLLTHARAAGEHAGGKDGVRQVAAELDDVMLYVAAAGPAAALAVLADHGTDGRLLGAELGKAARAAVPLLGAQPQMRGAVTRVTPG